MDALTFSLIYLMGGYAAVVCVWLVAAQKTHKLTLLLQTRSTGMIQSLMFALHVLSAVFFPMTLQPDIPVRAFGLSIFTLGFFVAVWGRLAMNAVWGLPGTFDERTQNHLITRGPFAHTRNPIYVGIILLHMGTAIALHSMFLPIVFLLYIHCFFQVRREEAHMEAHFQGDFVQYRQHVPRFI